VFDGDRKRLVSRCCSIKGLLLVLFVIMFKSLSNRFFNCQISLNLEKNFDELKMSVGVGTAKPKLRRSRADYCGKRMPFSLETQHPA